MNLTDQKKEELIEALDGCKSINGLENLCDEYDLDFYEATGELASRDELLEYLGEQLVEGDLNWLRRVLSDGEKAGCDWDADWFMWVSDGAAVGHYTSYTDDDIADLIVSIKEYVAA